MDDILTCNKRMVISSRIAMTGVYDGSSNRQCCMLKVCWKCYNREVMCVKISQTDRLYMLAILFIYNFFRLSYGGRMGDSHVDGGSRFKPNTTHYSHIPDLESQHGGLDYPKI